MIAADHHHWPADHHILRRWLGFRDCVLTSTAGRHEYNPKIVEQPIAPKNVDTVQTSRFLGPLGSPHV